MELPREVTHRERWDCWRLSSHYDLMDKQVGVVTFARRYFPPEMTHASVTIHDGDDHDREQTGMEAWNKDDPKTIYDLWKLERKVEHLTPENLTKYQQHVATLGGTNIEDQNAAILNQLWIEQVYDDKFELLQGIHSEEPWALVETDPEYHTTHENLHVYQCDIAFTLEDYIFNRARMFYDILVCAYNRMENQYPIDTKAQEDILAIVKQDIEESELSASG